MSQMCRHCSASFDHTPEEISFLESISPTYAGKKYVIPPSEFCTECRFLNRLVFRNDRHLYHRKSSLSGRQIISIYSPEKTFPVYDQDEWWSDAWDPLSYGKDVDFNRPFLKQLHELRCTVPRVSLFTTGSENSYYTNHALFLKNCYLIFGGGNDEDCLFGNYISFCKDTVDGLCLYSCERCYQGISSQRCYDCSFFLNCRDCSSCLLIEDCESCTDCIGCFGLHRKQYCIFNQSVGEEAFKKYRQDLGDLSNEKFAALQEQFEQIKMTLPHRSAHLYGSENCSGDAVYSSKNARNCFDVTNCEDCENVAFTPKGIASRDCTFTSPEGVDHNYYVASTVGAPNSAFTFLVWYGANMFYSLECHHCSDCFGCAGLRNKRYCILNKQYSKEEYEEMVGRIIDHMQKTGEWGEFFPLSMCPYGYNETNATDYFPKSREEALENGFSWRDESDQQETYLGPRVEIPTTINDVQDSVCDQILVCEITGKPFKVIPQELKFYREMGLPISTRCFEQRHKDRIAKRMPRKLWNRNCQNCQKAIETTYAPDRPEIIFCDDCYLKEVY